MSPTALITGGSGGIGRATALELADGYDVVVQYYSDEAAAERIVDEIRDDGNRAIAHQCDVSDRDAVDEMVDRTREEFDGVDVLVNNAAVAPDSDTGFADRTPESIDRALGVNLVGTMYCTQAVIEEMRNRGEGRIVNVASTAGVHGSPSDPVYGASKGGMVAFTKSLAKQYTKDGVLSNAVAPSVTDTPLIPAERREKAKAKFPQNRIAQPEEVAVAIRFLATELYDSGKVLEVAGGRYL